MYFIALITMRAIKIKLDVILLLNFRTLNVSLALILFDVIVFSRINRIARIQTTHRRNPLPSPLLLVRRHKHKNKPVSEKSHTSVTARKLCNWSLHSFRAVTARCLNPNFYQSKQILLLPENCSIMIKQKENPAPKYKRTFL